MSDMRRRAFITLLSGAVAAFPRSESSRERLARIFCCRHLSSAPLKKCRAGLAWVRGDSQGIGDGSRRRTRHL
jgi:hypothetical protein